MFPYFESNCHTITFRLSVGVWVDVVQSAGLCLVLTRVYQELVGFMKALLIITDVNIQCRSRFKRNPDKITLMDLFVEAGTRISV